MAVLFSNNAASNLSASITNTATSLSVTAGTGAEFPNPGGSDYFYATLSDAAGNVEIIKVTARSTDTLTIVRGQDGTTARAWANSDKIELRLTAAGLGDLKADTLALVNNGLLTITAGAGLTGSGTFYANQAGNTTISLAHSDTSSQASSTNSGATVIQSIGLDGYGHLTSLTTKTIGYADVGAPSTTGTNASGTWGISISGNAASASSVAWTNVSGRPTAVSSFSNDSGYITGSYLGDYTNGAYRVIADYSGSNTWYIRSNGRFTWARGHDWTQTFELNLESGTAASNNGWAEFGQRQSNNAAGTWYGTRFVQYTGSTKVDGHIRAGNHYLGADNSYITNAGDSSARVQTAYGYIDIGPKNGSWCHIYSDKAFYFNQELYINNVQVVKNSGTWGISITGNAATATSASSLSLSGHTISNSAWAGTGGYHGYTYSGGNFRFGFSSTAGVVDVYADGNFYATDSAHLVLHAGNFSSYAAPASHSHAYLPTSGGTLSGALTVTGVSSATSGFQNPAYYSGRNRIWSFGNADSYGVSYFQGSGGYGGSDSVGIHFGTTSADCNFIFRSSSDFIAKGAVTGYSDERLKTEWAALPASFVDELAALKSGTYTRTDLQVRQVGVGAQSLQKFLPEAILDGPHLSVAYGNAALVSAVELAKRVVAQEARIKRLETIIENLAG